jgi:N-carbamoylputrescine amidase
MAAMSLHTDSRLGRTKQNPQFQTILTCGMVFALKIVNNVVLYIIIIEEELIMRSVKVAATQMACGNDREENIRKAESLVREAASMGANLILLQEMFQGIYFCQEYNSDYFGLARTAEDNPAIAHFSKLAKELDVVIPISFFERSNNVFFNSVMMIDADGSKLGIYRKTHIPDDPGYYEKFYFCPGNTGFQVWNTKYGKVGIGICWDQWYPETARCLAIMGAEILLYPTAIGTRSAPIAKVGDLQDERIHWTNVMRGHAAANMIPVVTSNRIGIEELGGTAIRFYGCSFIADEVGEIVAVAGDNKQEVIIAEFDLDDIDQRRISHVNYRDRRPECYEILLTKDGKYPGL